MIMCYVCICCYDVFVWQNKISSSSLAKMWVRDSSRPAGRVSRLESTWEFQVGSSQSVVACWERQSQAVSYFVIITAARADVCQPEGCSVLHVFLSPPSERSEWRR